MTGQATTMAALQDLREEPVRLLLPALWIAGGLLAILLIRSDLAGATPGVHYGRDFLNLWLGGHIVRAGDVAHIYDLDFYLAAQERLFGAIEPHNYSYPPLTFPIAALFSWPPYAIGWVAWLASTGALFALAVRRAGLPLHPALALLTPAALVNIWAGQWGFLLGGLFLLGWASLERRPLLAGVCFGLMIVKPHVALLVPLVLLLRGEWRAIVAAAATAAALLLASVLLYGTEVWASYLTETSRVQAAMIDAGPNIYGAMSTSTATALLRVGVPWGGAIAGHAIVAAAALVLVLRSVHRGRVIDVALLAATCTFLMLPYAFNYDLTVVSLAALLTLSRAQGSTERLVAGTAFVVPQLGMLAALGGAPVAPLSLLALAVLQSRQLARAHGEQQRLAAA